MRGLSASAVQGLVPRESDDRRAYAVEFAHHLVVPETQYPKAVRFEIGVAHCVPSAFRVLGAVHLDAGQSGE
mgnify:CR=1 FL=1